MGLEQAKQKLDELEARYEQLGEQMMDPAMMSDMAQYRQVNKAWSDLTVLVTMYREYKRALSEIGDAEEMLSDPEMRDLAQTEIETLKASRDELEAGLRVLLLPKDPNDDKNVIVEIRPAAGGEEAALFAGDLFRMYSRYAERKGWQIEILNAQETGIGGFAEPTGFSALQIAEYYFPLAWRAQMNIGGFRAHGV